LDTWNVRMMLTGSNVRLAGCRLDFPSTFSPKLCILPGQTKSFHFLLDAIHHVFLGRPLGLVHSTSITVQHLIQSVSSLRSMCPNHLNPPFFITELTGSNPNSSLNSALFFLSFEVNVHIHLIMLSSVLSNFTSCSISIGQLLLPCIKQLLTHGVYTSPLV